MVERVNGERFTAVEPTPLLAECIDQARAALEAAAPDASVTVGKPLELGPGTELSPSLVVRAPGADPAGVPDVVVEFRTESTGRYVLGPKRMVYSRFRIPEFWYVDPVRRRVAVLRSESGQEYPWPPEEHDCGEIIELRPLPGVRVHVEQLVGTSFAERAAAGAEEAESWLEV